MVPQPAFVKKIRSLGYTFRGQQRRTMLYGSANGAHYIHVPRRDLVEEEFVVSHLRRAGLNEIEIKTFIGEAKTSIARI